jgi:predicted dehydrogenase
MDDARRIVDAAAASGRQVFVDMFGRFDPATEFLHAAIAQGRYGTLKTLTMELRSALLWEGYQIGLDSLARASWSWNATAAGHRSGSRSESCSASSPWPPRSGTTTRPDSQPYGP